MKQYSQITFDFNELSDSGENSGVGVRIKTLKKGAEEALKRSAEEVQRRSETEAASLAAKATDAANVPEIPDNLQPEPSQEEAFDPHHDNRNQPGDIDHEVSIEHGKQKSTRGRKSLKTIDENADLINVPPDEELFKKQYYAIGEVAEMFHVNQSLLRFWETEFDIIQPRKNRKGDRHFRPVDIKNLLLIHDLLRRRKLTIEGAKDFLKKNKRSPERFAMIQSLQKIKGFMLEIKAGL